VSIPPDADQAHLIEAFLRGDGEATRAVEGWIERALRDGFRSLREDWEDLKQEILLRIVSNLRGGRFAGDSSLRTYVHRISRNAAIDLARRAYRRRERGGPAADGPAAVRAGDEPAEVMNRDLLSQLLEVLPERDRRLIDLVFAQHLSYAEVARLLGVREGTVKARVFRCRSRLMRHWSHLMAATKDRT
jgi:RNA polymerase sigma-70 factor, ECF subfamily